MQSVFCNRLCLIFGAHFSRTDNLETMYTVKPKTIIMNLMRHFCNHHCLILEHFRTLFDGDRINLNSTVLELDMEENDT